MNYLVRNQLVQSWEVELAAAGTSAVPTALLLRLCWHLRQRDSTRSLELGQRLRAQLEAGDPEQQAALMRVLLAEAEITLLKAQPEAALLLCDEVLSVAERGGDDELLADASLLQAVLSEALHRSRPEQFDAALAAARRCGDAQRVSVIELRAAIVHCYRDPVAGRRLYAELAAREYDDPGIATWAHELQGTMAAQASDYGLAASARIQAFEEGLQSGQVERAITAAHNAAAAMHSLGELELALQWLQRAVELARRPAWPVSLALVLGQFGETLRMLGRLDAAGQQLQEAEAALQGLPQSRAYAILLRYISAWHEDRKDWPQALQRFEALERCAQRNGHPDLAINGCSGQARMLARLGQPLEAQAKALQALRLAEQSQHQLRQVEVMRVLAELHQQAELPPPPGIAADQAALHYLRTALALTQGLPGFRAPAELLEALAQALAARGEHAEACRMLRESGQAWARVHSEKADKRAIAMQAMQRTERARTEAEHQRQLTLELARRAEALQGANETMERLAAVGREITVEQGATALFATLDRHLRALLPAAGLVLAQLQSGGQTLLLRRSSPGGAKAAPQLLALAQAGELARAMWERRACSGPLDGGRLHAVPLLLGERCLGLLAVWLADDRELGAEQWQWLNSVAAFASIAIANAQAYEQLGEARQRLVAQARRVALGAMVAGVAHEVNTPLGNSMMAVSTLHEEALRLSGELQSRQLRRSSLAQYLERCAQAGDLLRRSLLRVLGLVQRYRQAGEQPLLAMRQPLLLAPLLRRAVEAARQVQEPAQGALPVDLAVAEDLWLDSRAEVLEQVLTQLIDNALRHGLAGRPAEDARLRLWVESGSRGRLRLHVSDNGVGIAAEHLDRVFDPFFSTRFGQGGSGLGLHLCRQWTHAWLDGELSLSSTPGQGSDFVLDLPAAAGAAAGD
ncbi:ATP-binding protein [Paucibacter sp. APW11]|uniref:histidine kinase n=1 Tax=Roseateles aquae TaxID=3077235 RepID=A0ABU3PH48_9BURK|nr:ATP-binding protein [Paucibacter sp. APW11]MDT9001863.1 ATP-binding protein [Paucibacter sp. APW11]